MRFEVVRPRSCAECGRPTHYLAHAKTMSGSTVFPYVCTNCGNVSAQYEKRATAESIWSSGYDVPEVETKTRARYRDEMPSCVVCGAIETELHHFAPRHLFGDECESWPAADLCRSCHKRWHDLVTPDMAKRAKKTEGEQ